MNEQDIISKKLEMYERVCKDFPFLKNHFEIQPMYQIDSHGQKFGGFNVRIFTDVGNGRIYLDTIVDRELKQLGKEGLYDDLKSLKEYVTNGKKDKAVKKINKIMQ